MFESPMLKHEKWVEGLHEFVLDPHELDWTAEFKFETRARPTYAPIIVYTDLCPCLPAGVAIDFISIEAANRYYSRMRGRKHAKWCPQSNSQTSSASPVPQSPELKRE